MEIRHRKIDSRADVPSDIPSSKGIEKLLLSTNNWTICFNYS